MAGGGDPKLHLLQLVNYEEEFNEEFGSYLTENGLGISSSPYDYKVVAIIGPQSSGKSTLLNLLFSTKFSTMDESRGRYQVTQGVWLGVDEPSQTIVMDLEGTDSRERGEDAVSFERKSSLFALAMSEILIINIWTQDVGRRNASNLALLRTVLELNMQLFQNQSSEAITTPMKAGGKAKPLPSPSDNVMFKTKLLFVLRDHVSSPLEKLAETLQVDLNEIWKVMDKSEKYRDSKLADFFDVDFRSLPHKILTAEAFEGAAEQLRTDFHSPSMFRPEYKRGVTIDGLPFYAKSVWETIRLNKDLDIPTQRLLVATVRCDQIAKDALTSAEVELGQLHDQIRAKGFVMDLGEQLHRIIAASIARFREEAHRYAKEVANEKEADLEARLEEKALHLFHTQSQNVSSQLQATLENYCAEILAAENPWLQYKDIQAERNECLKEYNDKCSVPSNTSISNASAKQALADQLASIVERAERDILKLGLEHVESSFSNTFVPEVSQCVESPGPSLWSDVSEKFEVALDGALSKLTEVTGPSGLNVSNSIRVKCTDRLTADCTQLAIKEIVKLFPTDSAISMRLMKRFDQAFRFTDRGLPRSWGSNDDIESMYLEALEQAKALVDLFSTIIIVNRAERELFAKEKAKDFKDQLVTLTSTAFLDAQRVKEATVARSKIPWWIFGLMGILGFNEFVAVVRNPWLFLLAVLCLPVLYFYIALDLNTVVEPAARALFNSLLDQLKIFLRDYLDNEPVNASAPMALSRSSRSTAVSDSTTPITPGPSKYSETSQISYMDKEE